MQLNYPPGDSKFAYKNCFLVFEINYKKSFKKVAKEIINDHIIVAI